MTRQLTQGEVAGVLSQLVARQGGVCAVCEQKFTLRDPAVMDHCHETGLIRGALHKSCNGAEGKVRVQAYKSHKGVSAEQFIIGLAEYLTRPKYQLLYPTFVTEDKRRLIRNEKLRIAREKAKSERQRTTAT